MKKTFNLFALLVVLGLVFSVVACSNKTEGTKPTEKPTTTIEDKTTTKEDVTTTEKEVTTTVEDVTTTEDTPTTTEHVHQWDEGEITTPATCTTKGVKTFTCSCGETKTEEVDALGHQAGETVYYTSEKHFNACTRCGFTLDFENLTTQTDFTDASWTQRKYTTAWETMTGQMRVRDKNGSIVVNMSAGWSMTNQYILNFEGTTPIAKGDSFSIDLGNYFTGAQPMGVKVSLVVKAGTETQTVYVLGDANNFYELPVTTALNTFSFTADQEVEVYEIRITNKSTMSGNGYLYMDNIKIFTAVNKANHTLVDDAAVAATCTEAGKAAGHHCSDCGYTDGGEAVAALGHDYKWVVDKEATVNEAGIQHEECSRCHDKKSENTAIDQLNGYEVKALGEHSVDITVIKTETGLKIVYKAKEDNNSFGYGACLDLPGTDYSVLLATTGNIAFQAYQNWVWDYKLPSSVGATVSRELSGEYMVSSFEFSDTTLGITEETTHIGVLLFEVVNANGAQYGIYNTQNNIAIDGGVGNFYKFQFAEEQEETPVLTKSFEEFGQGKANAKLEIFSQGVKITIECTPLASTFGYGVMFGNLETNVGTTDLYALGYGTVDHKTYGDWNWQGNYVNPTTVGIQASETTDGDKKTVELFYSFETLSSIGITKDTTQFGVQFFEYVTDSSGNLYACYNCLNVDGAALAFDTGVANFVKITK